jgi:membrane-bound lytic murein transglycosylase F
VGLCHVEDARVITQKRGGDPDTWMDVKERLPLLRKKNWYKLTKYGYARGDDAVDYVENTRVYYDLLVWAMDFQESSHNATLTAARTATSDAAQLAPAL